MSDRFFIKRSLIAAILALAILAQVPRAYQVGPAVKGRPTYIVVLREPSVAQRLIEDHSRWSVSGGPASADAGSPGVSPQPGGPDREHFHGWHSSKCFGRNGPDQRGGSYLGGSAARHGPVGTGRESGSCLHPSRTLSRALAAGFHSGTFHHRPVLGFELFGRQDLEFLSAVLQQTVID